MADEAGIEPTTPGLEGRCSIRLSYSPAYLNCSFEPNLIGKERVARSIPDISRGYFSGTRVSTNAFRHSESRAVAPPTPLLHAVR